MIQFSFLILLFVAGFALFPQFRAAPSNENRVNCCPDVILNETDVQLQARCTARKCTFDATNFTEANTPKCFLPNGTGMKAGATTNDVTPLTASDYNAFGADLPGVTFTHSTIGTTINVQIGAPNRFRPDPTYMTLDKKVITASESLKLEVTSPVGSPFAFKVSRASNGVVLWDTSIGGLFFADHFIQIATKIPTENVYGIGENAHLKLKHDFKNYFTYALNGRDQGPDYEHPERNLYGIHAFYIAVEGDGKAHGVFILNTSPQDITTGPGPHLVYRTVSGMLDIFFFPGPTPEQVIQQYLAIVGLPVMPAYWSLGYQISRYGYKDFNEMDGVIKNIQKAGIPLDVTTTDIDYMDRYQDFTLSDKWGKNYTDAIPGYHNEGLHIIPMFDPAITVTSDPFKRAKQQGAKFLKWPADMVEQTQHYANGHPETNGTNIALGVVWPDEHTAFPDFIKKDDATGKWWISEFVAFHNNFASYDGIWIDMNEPAVFGTDDDHPWYFDLPDHPNISQLYCPKTGANAVLDNLPYQTANVFVYLLDPVAHTLAAKTMCMSVLADDGKQNLLNMKNLYGLLESVIVREAMHQVTKKRGVVVSRSTFPTSGRYVGHWLGDNSARWNDLRGAVIGSQEFNMFGIPYVGSDICGFFLEAQEEMCLRWQQLGAYHPFFRNHNTNGTNGQDPTVWASVSAATKQANLFRYYYLPYLYSLHFEASLSGTTVIRPLFFEFPLDSGSRNPNFEFMWGPAMLVVPVTDEGARDVTGHVPPGKWYSMREGTYGEPVASGEVKFSAQLNEQIPVLIRGGYIVPRQKAEVTTSKARLNPFELHIALQESPTTNALGKLYWDDGESIIEDITTYKYYLWNFAISVNETTACLTIERTKAGDPTLSIPTLDSIEVFGYDYIIQVNTLMLNGVAISGAQASVDKRILKLSKSALINLKDGATPMSLTWQHTAPPPPATTTPSSTPNVAPVWSLIATTLIIKSLFAVAF